MQEVTLRVALTLTGPILTKASAIGLLGVDAVVAKHDNGGYYLPDSLVRGRLRHSLTELNGISSNKFEDLIIDMFGDESIPGQGNEPRRRRLDFTDFNYTGKLNNKIPLRYRIHIDSDRGSVAKGAYMVIETPFAPGEECVFNGEIRYLVKNKDEAIVINQYIKKGLRWITSFGAERTLSFGRLKDVVVEDKYKEIKLGTDSSEYASKDLLVVRLEIEKPFCIAKRRTVHNIFESDTVISGAALRGAFASTLKALLGLSRTQEINENALPLELRLLGKYFNRIRYTFAFPIRKERHERPVVPPLSIVKPAGNKNEAAWYDVATLDVPVLIGKPPLAPEFDVDWKESSDVRKHFGWDEPKTELRVRASIDRTTRRAREHGLFAYEMVATDKHYWVASIDLSLIPSEDRNRLNQELQSLLKHGLSSIGKTKAKANVTIADDISPKFMSDASPKDNRWIVTLQTPALLCDPQLLRETSSEADLYDTYNATWSAISEGTLKLKTKGYFARQSLAGGYLNTRFQPRKPYNPFLLTDAGSVFVLDAKGDIDRASKHIERWLRCGLDLPAWAKNPDRYGDGWKTNPLLPIDGFGEITVNLPCHHQTPPKELVHYV